MKSLNVLNSINTINTINTLNTLSNKEAIINKEKFTIEKDNNMIKVTTKYIFTKSYSRDTKLSVLQNDFKKAFEEYNHKLNGTELKDISIGEYIQEDLEDIQNNEKVVNDLSKSIYIDDNSNSVVSMEDTLMRKRAVADWQNSNGTANSINCIPIKSCDDYLDRDKADNDIIMKSTLI